MASGGDRGGSVGSLWLIGQSQHPRPNTPLVPTVRRPKTPINTVDERCIFDREWLCVTDKGCSGCYVFDRNKYSVSVDGMWRLWYAILQGMEEFKGALPRRRSYACSRAVDLERKSRPAWRNRLTRSEARRKAWAEGKYNGMRRKRQTIKFGEKYGEPSH